MAVYVDEIMGHGNVAPAAKRYGHKWCHMTADTVEELKEFAAKIGLQASWFQDHLVHPHFDLTPAMRSKALANGAVFKPAKEQARERIAKRLAKVQEVQNND